MLHLNEQFSFLECQRQEWTGEKKNTMLHSVMAAVFMILSLISQLF